MSSTGPMTIDLQTANWLDPVADVLGMAPGDNPTEITLSIGAESRADAMAGQALAMLSRYASENSIPLRASGDAAKFFDELARLGFSDCRTVDEVNQK